MRWLDTVKEAFPGGCGCWLHIMMGETGQSKWECAQDLSFLNWFHCSTLSHERWFHVPSTEQAACAQAISSSHQAFNLPDYSVSFTEILCILENENINSPLPAWFQKLSEIMYARVQDTQQLLSKCWFWAAAVIPGSFCDALFLLSFCC